MFHMAGYSVGVSVVVHHLLSIQSVLIALRTLIFMGTSARMKSAKCTYKRCMQQLTIPHSRAQRAEKMISPYQLATMPTPLTVPHNAVRTDCLTKPEYTRILEILSKELGCEPTPDAIRTVLKKQSKATVTSRDTGREVLMPSRRTGYRYTFGSTVVSQVVPLLPLKGAPVKPEMSHGDILLYEPGDEFKWHRDTIPEGPGREGMTYLTLLVGLTTTKGGETAVQYEDNTIHKHHESATTSRMLLFPSGMLHCGMPVLEGYKLALKLDFWINTTDLPKVQMSCTCATCEEEEAQWDMYYEERDDDTWCNGYDDYYD